MTDQTRLPFRLALSCFIVLASIVGSIAGASAATSNGHKAVGVTDLGHTGFLDLKTFMVVPENDDGEIGLASRQMRIISPETLWARQPRLDLLKSIRQDSGTGTSPGTPARFDGTDFDSLPIKVNGESVSLSLGLREAILKDIETNIRTYGDPGVFTGGTGFASASYLGAMTRDVLDNLDRLESLVTDPMAVSRTFAPTNDFLAQGPTIIIPAPPALPVFTAGLLLVGWLRIRRRNATRAAL